MPGGSYSALGSGGQASMPHALLPNPPKTLQRDKSKLRVAHFVTMTGTAGIWGPSSVNCAVLAAHQINARGGILGREVELSVIDTGAEIEDVTRDAEDIVESDGADVIVGNHISAIRMSLRKTFAGHLPYIYPSIYEGGERTPGLFAIGETPPRQARPAIAWLAERKRAQRWYLIGSDYVWPWLSHREVKSYIAETGGRVVGEDFVPLGDPDHHRYVERIRALQPDVVFISLIGLDGILFNRMFAEYGLSEKVLRLANCIDETVLLGIGAENTTNLFAAFGYFASVKTTCNEAFLTAYQKAFGDSAPIPGAVAQANYEALYFLEALARRSETLHLPSLTANASNIVYSGGRGPVGVRHRRAEMPIYFAEADGFDFRLLEKF
ncbi:MAG: substrate-binding domain-containing protein [Alphaproteobacteria bacterium]|nr:substrate-binding domain-containing protein [Alphaproteobacteria bacterium]